MCRWNCLSVSRRCCTMWTSSTLFHLLVFTFDDGNFFDFVLILKRLKSRLLRVIARSKQEKRILNISPRGELRVFRGWILKPSGLNYLACMESRGLSYWVGWISKNQFADSIIVHIRITFAAHSQASIKFLFTRTRCKNENRKAEFVRNTFEKVACDWITWDEISLGKPSHGDGRKWWSLLCWYYWWLEWCGPWEVLFHSQKEFTTKPKRKVKNLRILVLILPILAFSPSPLRRLNLERESQLCTYKTATLLPLFDCILFSISSSRGLLSFLFNFAVHLARGKNSYVE